MTLRKLINEAESKYNVSNKLKKKHFSFFNKINYILNLPSKYKKS